MTRLVFPADRMALQIGSQGAVVRNVAGGTAAVYADAAGTMLADIQTTDGQAIAGSTLTIDVSSRLPQFLGPNGVDTLYVQVNGGPVIEMTARPPHSNLGIYVPPGWGAGWRTALAAAKAGTGKAVMAAIGASSTQGYYASRLDSKAWPGLLRSSLQASNGDGGSGFKGSSWSAFFQSANGVPAAATTAYGNAGDLVTLTGTWTAGGSDFGPGSYYAFTSTNGDICTATGVRGTTIKIFVIDGNGTSTHSNWSYSIDGAAAVTVNDSAATQNIRVVSVNVTPGTHTVTLTKVAGGGTYLSVVGVAGENATGVVVNNLARYGSRAANFGNVDQSLSAPWNGGASYPADLVLLTHGPNDANSNDSGDTWAKWQRRIMSTAREANPNADLMIVLPHVGSWDATNYLYQDYASRARGLAEAFGAALVDMWTIGKNSWSYWQGLGYWANASVPGTAGSDQVHPSDAGHQAIANTLLPILTA